MTWATPDTRLVFASSNIICIMLFIFCWSGFPIQRNSRTLMQSGKSSLINSAAGGRLSIEVMCFFLNSVTFSAIWSWNLWNSSPRNLLIDVSITDEVSYWRDLQPSTAVKMFIIVPARESNSDCSSFLQSDIICLMHFSPMGVICTLLSCHEQ